MYEDEGKEYAWDFILNKITKDITLYPDWRYTVTIDSKNATPVDTQYIRLMYRIEEPSPAPTRDGFVFGGWYDDISRWNFNRLGVMRNMTLYAEWLYTVAFDSKGGTAVDTQYIRERSVDYGYTIEVPIPPTREGYVFGGWYDDKDNLWNFDGDVARNMTLYAYWYPIYTVDFDLQNGTSISSLSVEYPYLISSWSNLTPERDLYIFGGWYKERECTNKWNFEEDKVTQNMTLYAKWIPNALSKLEVTYAGGNVCVLSPSFSPASYEYTCNVPPEVTAVLIYARSPIYDADTKNTTLTGTGSKDLEGNSTTYEVKVGSHTYGNFEYTYIITVKKPPIRKRRRRCDCGPNMENCNTGPND
jgi:uncharacterized repeat protein (TIGR02543 family)